VTAVDAVAVAPAVGTATAWGTVTIGCGWAASAVATALAICWARAVVLTDAADTCGTAWTWGNVYITRPPPADVDAAAEAPAGSPSGAATVGNWSWPSWRFALEALAPVAHWPWLSPHSKLAARATAKTTLPNMDHHLS